MTDVTRIVFLTDAGFLKPTLVAMASTLDAATQPVEVHFVTTGLGPRERDSVRRVAAHWPQHSLEFAQLEESWLSEAQSSRKWITTTTLGKLFLPRLIGERFIYLDGDILVRRDLSPLMEFDFGSNLLAGVPDYVVSRWAAKGRKDRLETLRPVIGDAPPGSYINGGVLVYNSLAIRAVPGLLEEMGDMVAAAGTTTVDQNRINQIFAGRIAALDPVWNASWGRVKKHRAWIEESGITALARPEGGGAVLHFHGPSKPWRFPTPKMLGKGGKAVLEYRLFLWRYKKLFPDLVP